MPAAAAVHIPADSRQGSIMIPRTPWPRRPLENALRAAGNGETAAAIDRDGPFARAGVPAKGSGPAYRYPQRPG